MITVLPGGAILAWIRLETGSIWPCIMVHAAWNALINAGFTFAAENIWIGETGILFVTTLILAALFLRRTWKPAALITD
jgi:membrane protease YdiL (CAAX protease family)